MPEPPVPEIQGSTSTKNTNQDDTSRTHPLDRSMSRKRGGSGRQVLNTWRVAGISRCQEGFLDLSLCCLELVYDRCQGRRGPWPNPSAPQIGKEDAGSYHNTRHNTRTDRDNTSGYREVPRKRRGACRQVPNTLRIIDMSFNLSIISSSAVGRTQRPRKSGLNQKHEIRRDTGINRENAS